MRINFRKLINYYKFTAVLLLNIGLLFLLINILGFIGINIRENYFKQKTVIAEKYGEAALGQVYPGFNAREIAEIQRESWSNVYLYEPFTQFKEKPTSGNYVNVTEAGFRLTKNQGPWPPNPENFNVFLFGGSTTFGYGLPDDQTIASYLQDYLARLKKERVSVYNFGRGAYFSTQERILFEQLLTSGYIPDLAIFIDGMNDFYFSQPLFTKHLEQFQQFNGEPLSALKFYSSMEIKKLPITRLARFFGDLIIKQEELSEQATDNDSSVIDQIINRYLENKKIIEAVAVAYKTKPIFVWQPSPAYKYDLQYHLFVENRDFGVNNYMDYGYPRMAEIYEEELLGDNFFWLADIQEGIKEPLYVDKVHYTARMSQKLAKTIVDLLKE
ncbi:MAG: SGNH/GDSL hydrolase family protein [Candidatus Nealsonbacteria bacterium]